MAVNAAGQISQLASKFRGCLMGGLVGDCIGSPFEGEMVVTKSVLSNYFKNLLVTEEGQKGVKQLAHPYTDDTAMTRALAESLITNKGFNAQDIAQRFTTSYYNQPKRGYGFNVVDVFKALRDNEYKDVYGPAKAQFSGSGSYGNGGAMRIAPVALFCYKNEDKLIEIAKNSTLITHANKDGYNGAILQCLAIHQALRLDPNKEMSCAEYLDSLINKMEGLEGPGSNENLAYTSVLKKMKELMLMDESELTWEETVVLFGNSVSALRSVPTAIYAFLRGLKQTSDYEILLQKIREKLASKKTTVSGETDNPFLRTLYFAISVGGDTDTIAAMASSIAGAYHGISSIPESLQKRCEDHEVVLKLADQLLELSEG